VALWLKRTSFAPWLCGWNKRLSFTPWLRGWLHRGSVAMIATTHAHR